MIFTKSLQSRILTRIIPFIFIVFVIIIVYISFSAKVKLQNITEVAAVQAAQKYAREIGLLLNKDASQIKGIANAFSQLNTLHDSIRQEVVEKTIEQTIKENNDYVSLWVNFELSAIQMNYQKNHGRLSTTFTRFPNGTIVKEVKLMEVDSYNALSFYNKLKKSKNEALVNPSYYSYTGVERDKVLKTTYCVPMLNNNVFEGLVGVDLDLDHYHKVVSSIKAKGQGSAFLIANNGLIFAHPNIELAGKPLGEVFKQFENVQAYTKFLKSDELYTLNHIDRNSGEENFVVLVPIQVGEAPGKWAIAYEIPLKTIEGEAESMAFSASLIGLLGLVVLMLVLYFIIRGITRPLKQTTAVLDILSRGNIDEVSIKANKRMDELGAMNTSLKALVDGLKKLTQSVRIIGEGDFNKEVAMMSTEDAIGHSLKEMQAKLQEGKKAQDDWNAQNKIQTWITQGEADFAEIVRRNNSSLESLSLSVIKFFINYVNAQQGALFLRHDNDSEPIFTLEACMAYNRVKTLKRQFFIGEGLVGRCAFEKLVIYMEEVPENYVHITSGLGEANPRSILLVPVKNEDSVYGVLELVFFEKLSDYQINFVEKMGSNLASTLVSVQDSIKMQTLLQESRLRSEELAAQEEEMRQNLEELQATQEELMRIKAANEAGNTEE